MFDNRDLMPFAGHHDFAACVATLRKSGMSTKAAMAECERLREGELAKNDTETSNSEPIQPGPKA